MANDRKQRASIEACFRMLFAFVLKHSGGKDGGHLKGLDLGRGLRG